MEWQSIDAPTRRGLARAIAAGEITNRWKYTFAWDRAGHDFALRGALAEYEFDARRPALRPSDLSQHRG